MYFCIFRFLIRRGDTGEIFDFAGSGLFIQALWIPFLSDFDRNVDEHFDKRNTIIAAMASGGVQVSCNFSIGFVWRDK